MANIIKIKAGNGVPGTSDIVDREIAFNRSDNKLYINDSGTIVPLSGAQGGGSADEADRIVFDAQAGEALSKGDVVYISGISGNTPIVSKADADDANKMPSFGLAAESATLNNSVQVVTFGTLENFDTSAFSVGDTVFVSTTAGGLTATAPTGESGLIQNMGHIVRSHASTGAIKIVGAGRTAATPNLNQDKIFLGNASNQSTPTALSSIGLSKFNNDSGFTTNTGTVSFNGSTANGLLTYSNSATAVVESNLTFGGSNLKLLVDGGKFTAGAGEDFSFYHSGTHSWIDNLTGNLYIRNQTDDGQIIMQTDDGSGGTTTYMSLKGNEQLIRFLKNTRHNDGVIAQFGSGGDLRIQHDGSNSWIYNDTGNLYIENRVDDGDLIFRGDNGTGGLTPYITLDGSTTDLLLTPPGNVGIGATSPSNTFEVKSGSTTPFGIKNGSNSTRLQVSLTNDDADIFLYDRNTTLQTALRSEGDSYFNQGNVGIGQTSPGYKLDVSGTGRFTGHVDFDSTITIDSVLYGNQIDFTGELNFTGAGNKIIDIETLAGSNSLTIRHHNPTGNLFENALKLNANAGAEIYYNNVKKFETTSTGAKFSENFGSTDDVLHINPDNGGNRTMTINGEKINVTYTNSGGAGPALVLQDNGGNVGIGTESPNTLLHLYTTSNTQLRLQSNNTGAQCNIIYQNGTASYSVGINSAEQFSFYSSQLGADAGFINTNGNLHWNHHLLLNANHKFIYAKDTNGTNTRILGLNNSNTTYIGPIDSYAGGSVVYGISSNVLAHYFYTDGAIRMKLDGPVLDIPNTGDWSSILNNTNSGGLRFGTKDSGGTLAYQIELSNTGNYVKLNENTTVTGNLTVSGSITGTASNSTLLNNLGAGSFLRSDTGDTAAGNITFTGKLLGDTNTTSILNGVNVSNLNTAFSNDISTSKASGLQPFRYSNSSTNTPLGGSGSMANNANWGLSLYSHGTGGSGNYGLQMSGGDNDNQLFFIRRVTNGSFGSWFEVWHSGNDGANSGLDADLLDGQHASAFLTGNQTITLSGDVSGSGTTSITTTVADNSHDHHSITSFTGDPGNSRLQYWETNANTTLNPTTDWYTAIRMGHGDPVTYYSNTLAIQMTGSGTGTIYTRNTAGGTAGSWNKYWHENNDGATSGLDADLLDGLHGSSYWTKGGSWVGDLGSNGYTRVQGVNNGGGEFVLALKNNQLHTLIDGSYFAYEGSSSTGGGFWSSYNSAYGNATGFKATGTSTIAVTQQDGGSANLEVTGTAKISGSGGYTLGNVADQIRIQTNGSDTFSFLNTGNGYASGNFQQIYTASFVQAGSGVQIWDSIHGFKSVLLKDNTYTKILNNDGAVCAYFGDNGDRTNYFDSGTHRFRNASGNEYMRIQSGNISGVGSNISLRRDNNDHDRITIEASEHKFIVDAVERLSLTSSGAAVTGNVRTSDGSAASPAFSFNSDPDLGFYRNGANNMRFSAGNSIRGTWNGDGLVLNGGSLGVNVAVDTTDGVIRAGNDVIAYYSSDERLKENVKPIDNALDKVSKIRGVEFDWIVDKEIHPNEGHDVGVIAQEIEKVLPEVVETRDSGYKAVKYEKIVSLLIEAVKEQQQQINELKEKLNG